MIWLGLFLSLASIPGYTSAAIPAGWAALSLTLPIVAWRSGIAPWPHVAMGLFLLYVFASIAWSVAPLDGIFRLWQLCLVAGCFWLGTVQEPKLILIGLAWGFIISTILAVGQLIGLDVVVRYNWNNYPGLHFSGVFAGAIGIILIIALMCERLWLIAVCCIPGVVIASLHSRGALIAGIVGCAAFWIRRVWLLAAACIILLAYVFLSNHNSDIERRAIWHGCYTLLTWLGQGSGSLVDLFVQSPFGIVRVENAHNDPLQLVFEFGVGTLPFICIWVALCLQTSAKHWPAIICFTILSMFFFPLFTPLSAAIFALCAGATVRDWSSTRDLLHSLRCLRLLWKADSTVPVSLST